MSSNFEYIKSQFPEVYAAAREAEENAFHKPITSAIYSRQTMEFLVYWVYQVDHVYEIPYQNTLSAKIRGNEFQRDVPPRIIRELEFMRKFGKLHIPDLLLNENDISRMMKISRSRHYLFFHSLFQQYRD